MCDASYLANLRALKARCDDKKPAVIPEPGGLNLLMQDVMAPSFDPPARNALDPKTESELAATTKAERTAYHKARRDAESQGEGNSRRLTKQERRLQQEREREAKANRSDAVNERTEMLAELMMQGLSRDQAEQMLIEMEQANGEDASEDASDDEETLLQRVRRWMACYEHEFSNEDPMRDFNLQVRFQGFEESTPPDHLRSVLQVISLQALDDEDVRDAKQPGVVSAKLQPLFSKWAYMLSELYNRCDVLRAPDIVVGTVSDSVAAISCIALVGILMAIREHVPAIEDEDLHTGCRNLRSDSRVVMAFIEHLEPDAETSDEGEGDVG